MNKRETSFSASQQNAAAVRVGQAQASLAELSKQNRRVSSATLLGGGRELEIVHEESLYRLRVTSTGKLILTK